MFLNVNVFCNIAYKCMKIKILFKYISNKQIQANLLISKIKNFKIIGLISKNKIE